MATNWSLVLNVLLLVGVVAAIARVMQARRKSLTPEHFQSTLSSQATLDARASSLPQFQDDIISVRKISPDLHDEPLRAQAPELLETNAPKLYTQASPSRPEPAPTTVKVEAKSAAPSVMMFLLAKEGRQLAGYELLQTLLASGLRFGEGQIFHRHQYPNGQGPVMCSLAAATESGTFDMQNIGAFCVRGLCLFMQSSGNPSIDAERFTIMVDTAKQLAEGLDAELLDDKRKRFSQESFVRYQRLLCLDDLRDAYESAIA